MIAASAIGLLLHDWSLDVYHKATGVALAINLLNTASLFPLGRRRAAQVRRMDWITVLQSAAALTLAWFPGAASWWAPVALFGLVLNVVIVSSFIPFLVLASLVAGGTIVGLWQMASPSAAVATGTAFLSFVGVCYLVATQRMDLERERKTSARARHSATQLVAANMEMQHYAVRTIQTALSIERKRVAREVHDVLGHSLTATAVQLQNGLSLIDTEPDRAHEEISVALGVIRASLTEVRSYVSSLRAYVPPKPKGRVDWVSLGQMFAQCTGLHVQILAEEEFADLDENTNDAVHRVIQEGLTNAYRHGYATSVRVNVWREDAAVLVKVSDNGLGAASLREGNGMRGMRERVEELGGKLAWDSVAGLGFDLGVELPCAVGAADG